jgi:hypothetical protein
MAFTNRVRIQWFGARVLRRIDRHLQGRLAQVATEVRDQVKENISIPTAVYGPSMPGEYPHLDSGQLRESVYGQVVGDSAYVGATAPHAKIVELRRSYLKRTMIEMRRRIKEILSKPWR